MAATTSLLSIPKLNTKLSLPLQKWQAISHHTPHLSFKSPLYPSIRVPSMRLQCSAVQEVAVAESGEATSPEVNSPESEETNKRKLYVVNLPWTLTGPEIQTLFSECGAVKDVEIIKQKNGKSRGFAFVTMASPEEASAAIEKFSSYELSGRTIRVEFAKRFRKPPPPALEGPVTAEERHKVYVSNVAWKARAANLRELFAAFNPISTRVVFKNRNGRSAGYGFVAFKTKEEAEAAIAELNGKELMGRPLRLKMSEPVDKKSKNVAQDSEESNNVAQDSEKSESVAQDTEEKEV